MVKAVLFDIDGTLLSEKPLIMFILPQVYDELANKLNISRMEARRIFLSEIEKGKGSMNGTIGTSSLGCSPYPSSMKIL